MDRFQRVGERTLAMVCERCHTKDDYFFALRELPAQPGVRVDTWFNRETQCLESRETYIPSAVKSPRYFLELDFICYACSYHNTHAGHVFYPMDPQGDVYLRRVPLGPVYVTELNAFRSPQLPKLKKK